jgi:hypothetical protein
MPAFSSLLEPYRPALEAITGPAATFRERLPAVLNSTALATADEKILAVMAAMNTDPPDIATCESALEDLRSTIAGVVPDWEITDPNFCGVTTVTPGVSVVFAWGSFGAFPAYVGNGTFIGFRSACRAALGLPAGNFSHSL